MKKKLNLNGITFPMSWHQIDVFERLSNLKIDVYGIKHVSADHDMKNKDSDALNDGGESRESGISNTRAVLPKVF